MGMHFDFTLRPLFKRRIAELRHRVTARIAVPVLVLAGFAVPIATWSAATAAPDYKCRKVAEQIGVAGDGTPICQEVISDPNVTEWNVPYGVTSVDVFVVGAGGGGGGGTSDTKTANKTAGYSSDVTLLTNGGEFAGGGGGGGSQAIYKNVAVSGSVSIAVGAGGASGAAGVVPPIFGDTPADIGQPATDGQDGGVGGTTSFGANTALGGTGGKGALQVGLNGAGGASQTNVVADATSAAFVGGSGATPTGTYRWFSGGGGGAGSAGNGDSATSSNCDVVGCDMKGGNGGASSVITLANSLFASESWTSSVKMSAWNVATYGFGPGAGGAVSVRGSYSLTNFTGVSGRVVADPNDFSLDHNGAVIGNGDFESDTVSPYAVGTVASLSGTRAPGAGGGGGVGYSTLYLLNLTNNDPAPGARGADGVIVIHYLAGPLVPCANVPGSTTTIDTITQITVTEECSFTAPDGVTSYDLLMVGGGGGSGAAYLTASGGGGGGEVVLCRDINAADTPTVTMKPGAGGAGSDIMENVPVVGPNGLAGESSTATDANGNVACVGAGGNGSIAASGPQYPSGALSPQGGDGAASGNGNTGGTGGIGFADWDLIATYYLGAGGGAGDGANGASAVCPAADAGSPAADCPESLGGDGSQAGALPGAATSLFASETTTYGGGGGGGNTLSTDAAGGAGGGGNGGSNDSGFPTTGLPNTGGGGGGAYAPILDGEGMPYAHPFDGAAGGSGVIIIRYVTPINSSTPTITTSQVSDETITFGGTVGDSVTVTNDTDGEASDPSGFVTFYYCYDSATVPSTCDEESGTQIGESVTVTGGGSGSSTAALTGWTPAHGAGYYLFHAVYAGDESHDPSADDGTNEAVHVKKKAIRVTPSGSTITAGNSASYPYSYSNDFVAPDDSSTINSAPSCGSDYTTTSAAGSYVITCSGGSDENYWFEFDTATLTVQKKTSSVVYTGLTFDVDGGSTTPLTATVSDGCGGSVTFTVYNIDGVLVDSVTATVSGGSATYNMRLPFGIYTVTATYNGSDQCETNYDDAAVSVVNPNDPNTSTTGGGYYKKQGFVPQRSNFGYTVQKVFNSSKVLVGYKGQLLWLNGKAWRLKGTVDTDVKAFGSVTCPAKDSTGANMASTAKCVTFRGSGILQKWDSMSGGWKTATQYGTSGRVTFTVTVYDGSQVSVCKGSGKTKTCSSVDQADSFGIQIDPVASTVLPETIPLSLQAPGNNGAVQIK